MGNFDERQWGISASAVRAVIFAWLTWRQSRSEISSRLRPWVGLDDFKYELDHTGKPHLYVKLLNSGPLPALNAHLIVEVKPCVKEDPDEVIVSARSEKFEKKALMPSEPGHYTILLKPYPQVQTWIDAERNLSIDGTFTYALGKVKYESKFAAELWFAKPRRPDGSLKTNWRNVYAT
ncbi:hypothetical protein BST36_30025 [Mycolicibacterium moriokaense]|uniref:Uncharacterized protein n=1 Tax=Mycolicibacterium moriokaense TaxID=39691 RepID=A0AAD1M6C4_9MYCO|nr:hypothetical protein [Mycolicibacterium moriokaense]MCV7041355.1 hypothetical protein [Mycolicibacterium moriokaense]ORB12488.1 hypothetical protein BST36_30025 [Mycolicibacterium moriokaense]BBX01938.1 hypothetical protein MMOR_28740 [Mycolicibacterium moriokaense]